MVLLYNSTSFKTSIFLEELNLGIFGFLHSCKKRNRQYGNPVIVLVVSVVVVTVVHLAVVVVVVIAATTVIAVVAVVRVNIPTPQVLLKDYPKDTKYLKIYPAENQWNFQLFQLRWLSMSKPLFLLLLLLKEPFVLHSEKIPQTAYTFAH